MRKLRRVAEAAVALVEGRRQLLARTASSGAAVSAVAGSAGCRRQVAEDIHQRVVLRAQLLALRVVVLGHALEDGGEGGHAVTRLVRKIRAAEERLVVVVRQEHGQRPAAAALREHLVRELVDLVEVGPLFAIDLDVHEQLVHERRGRRRPRTTRAPSRGTSGRPNSRSDSRMGLPLVAGEVQRFLAPGMPVDGIRRVLLQVGAGFPCQPILVVWGASLACIGR